MQQIIHLSSVGLGHLSKLGPLQYFVSSSKGTEISEFDDCDFVEVAVVKVAAVAISGVPDSVTCECWLGVFTVPRVLAVATTWHLLGS